MRSCCHEWNGREMRCTSSGIRSLDPVCPFSARGGSFFVSPERVRCLVPVPSRCRVLMACGFFRAALRLRVPLVCCVSAHRVRTDLLTERNFECA